MCPHIEHTLYRWCALYLTSDVRTFTYHGSQYSHISVDSLYIFGYGLFRNDSRGMDGIKVYSMDWRDDRKYRAISHHIEKRRVFIKRYNEINCVR